ncbi:uncharacterized protein LOC119561873 [Drosophila subpulchrella]|uniref:uncharacterized protein LOC119561873 n=1 Tax=Drosophila subpulchrella TaxID=1486046 RepID=UPI0018A196C4|nr:uncharacterized protein LOC119561873 [Drosophila subpulchrella]
MAAHQPSGESSPGQGWSTARPTQTSRRISGRGVPEPVISSDSDVELVEDQRVEQRRWRLRRAVNRADGRIPTGAAEVEWASKEPPQDQQAPGSHAESLEYRRNGEEWRLKEMEESPEWRTQLQTANEEEQQLWESPGYPPRDMRPSLASRHQKWQKTGRPHFRGACPKSHSHRGTRDHRSGRQPDHPVDQQQHEQRQQQQPDPPKQQQGDPMRHHPGGAPILGGERSPGPQEPDGPQDPRQTGELGPTDTEHLTDDTKNRAGDVSARRDRERDG